MRWLLLFQCLGAAKAGLPGYAGVKALTMQEDPPHIPPSVRSPEARKTGVRRANHASSGPEIWVPERPILEAMTARKVAICPEL